MRHWPIVLPLLAMAMLAAALGFPLNRVLVAASSLALMGAVVAAVHHAEVVALRVGEPFATLVLAIAITVIEVALIVSIMLAGGPEKATLARDSVYATVMIICSGVMGGCLVAGALRHHEQTFRTQGAEPALAALITLSAMVLVLPVFTTSAPVARYSTAQLWFAALVSFGLWAVFIFVQTVRHRDYFLPPQGSGDEDAHAPAPGLREAWGSFTMLLVALVAVVGLAKTLSPRIEAGLAQAGAPQSVVGIAIALLVLLPETVAALRAALANRLQTSMNLALGSALASIGLTIPVVVAAAIWFDLPLVLGLEPKDLVLLTLACIVSSITLGAGRTNLMQGAVHLVIFAAFLFLSLVP